MNNISKLYYKKGSKTFFKQNELKHFEAKTAPEGYIEYKYGPEAAKNGTGDPKLIKWDEENIGYMIIAVPKAGPAFPKWKD